VRESTENNRTRVEKIKADAKVLDDILCDCLPSFENFIHPLSTLHYCNAPDLATRPTGDCRGRTYTDWCDPASLDTRRTG
jgi:hypothetical protein